MQYELFAEWRDIPGYEGLYKISSDGRIYSNYCHRELSFFVPKCGYWSVNLTARDGYRTCTQVHRLLALAFIDGAANSCRVHIRNGNKLDYRLDNLNVVDRKVYPSKDTRTPMEKFIDRFWDNTQVRSGNACWLWLGSTNRAGYGSMGLRGQTIMAHRASWLIHFGEILEGSSRLVVMHKCDNRRCVNPAHLQLGTHKDNIQDCIQKGRFRPFGHLMKKDRQTP